MFEKKNNNAFTLAEVLITLAILGVVSAMTIPVIMANKDKQAWASQLKKSYATLENARRLTALDYGGDISGLFDSSDATSGNVALQAFAPHLNITKNCGAAATGCWYDGMKYLNNGLYNGDGKLESTHNGTFGKAILADGTMFFIQSAGSSCSTDSSTSYSPSAYAHLCGWIYLDVNAKNPPNIYGRDVFIFHITRDGIYPVGISASDATINSDCSITGGGSYCAAKVLKEGVMNY